MGRKRALTIIFIFILLIGIIPSIALSDVKKDSTRDTPIKDIIADSLSRGKDICAVVGDMIRAGNNTAEVVENAIVMGHPACVVVRCAVDAGGKLEEVITAAFRAGATSDVIVTCAIEGGAEPDALARMIERLGLPGLGYTPPPMADVYVPTFIPTIGGGGGGEPVSRFRP